MTGTETDLLWVAGAIVAVPALVGGIAGALAWRAAPGADARREAATGNPASRSLEEQEPAAT